MILLRTSPDVLPDVSLNVLQKSTGPNAPENTKKKHKL